MRYLVLSDIHANYTALKAVLEDAPHYDRIINLGDILGLMGHPKETVEFLRDEAYISLIGNHDYAIIIKGEGHVNSQELSKFEHEYSIDKLSYDDFQYLKSLSSMERLDSFVLCHAMPYPEDSVGYEIGNRGILKKDYTSEAPIIEEKFGSGTIIMHGHTHEQAYLDTSKFGHEIKFLNPGSVGDKFGRAEYAIIETDTETVDLRRVTYDDTEVKKRLCELGIPIKFWKKSSVNSI